jgi:hypothetical protein
VYRLSRPTQQLERLKNAARAPLSDAPRPAVEEPRAARPTDRAGQLRGFCFRRDITSAKDWRLKGFCQARITACFGCRLLFLRDGAPRHSNDRTRCARGQSPETVSL